MLAVVLTGLWLRFRKRLYDSDWFLRVCEFAAPIGFLAVIAGWTTRNRPPTLDCLWPDAHGRFRFAVAHGF